MMGAPCNTLFMRCFEYLADSTEAIRTTVVPITPLICTTVVPISGFIGPTVVPIRGIIGPNVVRIANATGIGYWHDGSIIFSDKLTYALNRRAEAIR